MKAYLVTESDYSYSNTEAIFLERPLAEQYVEKFGKHLEIEEMEMGEAHHLQINIFDVWFKDDSINPEGWSGKISHINLESPFCLSKDRLNDWMGLHVYVQADDEAGANKKATEIFWAQPRHTKKTKRIKS